MNCQAMNEDSDIYQEYKREAEEILYKIRSSCERLKEHSDKDALEEIAKCTHKIKGVAGMMDYSHIAELAEGMESVSRLLIDGKLRLKPEIVALLLDSTNLLTKYIKTDFHERDATVLEKLRKLSNV